MHSPFKSPKADKDQDHAEGYQSADGTLGQRERLFRVGHPKAGGRSLGGGSIGFLLELH
jgi:hypothetical protein